jgi:hypothetical protein
MAAPIESAADRPKQLKPIGAILIVPVDILPPIAPRGDVIKSTGQFYA